MAKHFVETLKSSKFLGMLYTMKLIMLSLTALSKFFEIRAANFRRVIPNIAKTESNLKQHFENDQLKLLNGLLVTRLEHCNLMIDKHADGNIKSVTEMYAKVFLCHIHQSFPLRALNIIDIFFSI